MSDDIKLPPLFMPGPRGYDPGELRAWGRACFESGRAAQMHDNSTCISKLAESDKQDHCSGVTKKVRDHVEGVRHMVPSDEEIDKLSHGFALQYQDHVRGFARALLSRYSSGQPASCGCDDDLLGCAGVTRHHDGGTPMIIGVTDIHRFADCVRKHYSSGQPAAPSGLGFRIEDRAGIRALAQDAQGGRWCRPASETECALWDALMSGQPAASAELDIIRAIRELTSHLADVLPDAAWNQIDVKKWNDLTRFVGIAELAQRRATSTHVAQEPVLVGWTVGVDGGGILHAAKYTEDEAKRAGYPLAVYRLVQPESAPVAAQAQPVAFAKDGVLFWHGEHAAWRGFNGGLYLAAQPSAQDREDAASITNPLTPYGLLIRALRLVAGTTLMEMSEGTGYTPSYLSSVESGREVPTDALMGTTQGFFCDKGMDVPLSLLQAARAAKGAGDA